MPCSLGVIGYGSDFRNALHDLDALSTSIS